MSAEHSDLPGPGQLPIAADAGRGTVLALTRPQQTALSLDLRGPEKADDDEIDLLDYWRVIVKRRWTVLATAGIILVTALVGTLLMTPIFRATSTVQIERDTIKVVDVQGLEPTESPLDKDFYQTQYELLQSRSLAQRVITQLNLQKDPVFLKMTAPSPWARLLGKGGDEATRTKAERSAQLSEDIDAFGEHLSIEPVRNSRLVHINYDSPDPTFSAKVANAIAQAYIASNLERRFESSSYAKSYLEDRLQQLKLKLEDSEKQLVAFAQKERIVDGKDGISLPTQNLAGLNDSLAKAQEARIEAESKWRQAQASKGLGLPDVLNSVIIQTLQESRAKLLADYQDKLRIYKPDYPAMQQLKNQIDETDKQIANEVGNIKASINAQYQAALAQETLIRNQMDSLKTEVLDLQSRSIQFNILKREADTNREQYDALLQRYKDIGVAGGVGANNISVVDNAEVPTGKFKPRLSLNLAIALLLGVFAGVMLALLFEHLDDSIKSPEDVEKLLGLSVLGVIPRLKDGTTPAQASEDLRSAFAEAYRSVRTALQFSTDQGVPRVLLVTSASPAEGKSTTSITLAKNFAQLGKKVLLIDADLRNPSLHRLTKSDNSAGLSNLLAGAAKASEVVVEEQGSNLSFITSGPLPPNPAELLMGSKMLSMLTVASQKYDQVIIDAPPVMGLADAPILSNMASGTLLVVEAGETRSGTARNALKRLLAARGHVVGALLTKYDAKVAGYGYGYGDYNYYSYGGPSPAPASKRLGKR